MDGGDSRNNLSVSKREGNEARVCAAIASYTIFIAAVYPASAS
jgi:hypothetical protein